MSTEPAAARGACPQDEDVVIIYRNGRWEVGPQSGPPSVSYARYDDAIAIMRPFAQRQHVDVWVARDGISLERVVRHRTEMLTGGRARTSDGSSVSVVAARVGGVRGAQN